MATIHDLRSLTGLGAPRLARLLGADSRSVQKWLAGGEPSAARQGQIDELARLSPEALANVVRWLTQPRKKVAQ